MNDKIYSKVDEPCSVTRAISITSPAREANAAGRNNFIFNSRNSRILSIRHKKFIKIGPAV